MAATVELRQSGANSATFFTFSEDADPTIDLSHWQQLPPGRLKDLMTQPWPEWDDFYRAFADAGGSLTTSGGYDDFDFAGFDRLADDYVGVSVLSTRPIVVRIALAYSASE